MSIKNKDQKHPALSPEESLAIYKQEAAMIARQLCYKPCIIAEIHEATNEAQVARALKTGRELM